MLSVFYLEKYFLSAKESERLKEAYRKGELLSGEVKQQFGEKMSALIETFQTNLRNVKESDFEKVLMQPEHKVKPELIEIWGRQDDAIKSDQNVQKQKAHSLSRS